MESYYSDESYEDGDHFKSAEYSSHNVKKKTFVPKYGSEMSLYKTQMCRYLEKYDHTEPIPVWVKDVYKRMWNAKNKKKGDFDSNPGFNANPTYFEDNEYYFYDEEEDEEDYEPDFVESNISPNRKLVRSDPSYETHSVGIPIATGTPVDLDDDIEGAYKKLKIESLDHQATIAKLQRDNEELEKKLQESSKKCMNYESTIAKYKGNSDWPELGQVKKAKGSKENQIIQELKEMVKELQEENSKLTHENKELLSKNDEKDPPGDSYYEIVIYVINQLEEITRSYLTKKLMTNPVLTPSLTIVDRQDVFNILDYNPEHPYNKVQEFQKAKIYRPMKSVVDLRYELKRMVEEQESNDGDVKVSDSNTLSDNSEQLLEKISQLESRLKDRNEEIKGCNVHKTELKNKLYNWELKVAELEDELALIKKGNLKLTKNSSKSYTEADVADYKRQITQLHESIRKYKSEEVYLI